MEVGGLFGGIGGALLGAKRAGFNVLFNIEPRPFFNLDTFKNNFPGSYVYTSIKDATEKRVTLLIGSPDCKQFSNLGTKRKDKGKLHELNPETFDYVKFIRYVEETQPDNFILENVPNVLKTLWFEDNTLNFVGYENPVLSLPNYAIQTIKLNAVDFGVAQNRRRAFVIGSRHFDPFFDLEELKKTDFVKVGGRWNMGPSVEAAFKDVDKKPNQTMPRHSIKRVEGFRRLKFEESYYGTQNNKRLHPDKPSGVVASHCSRFVHPYKPRVLTVRESARLMGFPDHFIFHGTETNQLDQVGKSIVPQVATAISYYIKSKMEDAIERPYK